MFALLMSMCSLGKSTYVSLINTSWQLTIQSCEKKIRKFPFKPQQVEIDLEDKFNGSALFVVLFSTLGALEFKSPRSPNFTWMRQKQKTQETTCEIVVRIYECHGGNRILEKTVLMAKLFSFLLTSMRWDVKISNKPVREWSDVFKFSGV